MPTLIAVTWAVGLDVTVFRFSDTTNLYDWMNEESCTPLAGTATMMSIDEVTDDCDNINYYIKKVDVVTLKISEWTAAGEVYQSCYPRYHFRITSIPLSPSIQSKMLLITGYLAVDPSFYNAHNNILPNDVKVEFYRVAA